MSQYILHNLPPELWAKVHARAGREGWPLRQLFLALLDDYADQGGAQAPTRSDGLNLQGLDLARRTKLLEWLPRTIASSAPPASP